MSNDLTVSVIIVSRDRAEALQRCLLAISQLWFNSFEVVVVADLKTCERLKGFGDIQTIKLVPFDEPNVSAARNTGIAMAAGEIIAFIDDDAVPEPTWLSYLAAPFVEPDVMAAAGFVRARNGISWQYRAQSVDRVGQVQAIEFDPTKVTVLTSLSDRAIKTQGTNMAFRRSCLAEMGGFDTRFRFFLDETDLNLRMAARRLKTAIVPCAQVHHGFAASARRRSDRVPTDLYDIGSSWAVFLRKHCDLADRAARWAKVQNEQQRRLFGLLVTGGLEPRDVRRLTKSLQRGYRDGLERKLSDLDPIGPPIERFRPFRGAQSPEARRVSRLISGRSWSRGRLRKLAEQAVAVGEIVTVLRLSPTALYHRVEFLNQGYWLQTGGLFGKSERTQKMISFGTFRRRVRAEAERVKIPRGFDVGKCQ
jgi:glycosyltransferase involved in cell wall biosynthesis